MEGNPLFSKYQRGPTITKHKRYLQHRCNPDDKMATATKSKKPRKKTSKRSNEKYRDILRNAREGLVKDMNVDDVLLYMTSLQVFSETDEEEIKSDGSNSTATM